jgi:hypothetical protein
MTSVSPGTSCRLFTTCFETGTGEGDICFELLKKGQAVQKRRFMEDIDT